MLGARQYAAFTKAIKASTATWKVVVNEVPIQQYYALPYDRWEGYAAEREKLLVFLKANVRNVVFLTTDTHANLVNEVRSRTLGATPERYGIWEVASIEEADVPCAIVYGCAGDVLSPTSTGP